MVRDDVLLQTGCRRESAVVGAGEAALAITSLLGNVPAAAVLCFVRDEAVAGWSRDVMVCSTLTLTDLLTSRPQVLHPSAVARVAAKLSSGLRSADQPATYVPSRRPATVRSPAPLRRGAGAPGRVALAWLGGSLAWASWAWLHCSLCLWSFPCEVHDKECAREH